METIISVLFEVLFFRVGRIFLQSLSFGKLYCPKRYLRNANQNELSTMSYDEWAKSGMVSWGLWIKQPDGRILVAAWLCSVVGICICLFLCMTIVALV